MMFFDRIESLIKKRGITKKKFSEESGMSYSTLLGYKTKNTDKIRLNTLIKLSEFFEVTLDYLVYGDRKVEYNNIEGKLLIIYRNMNHKGQKILINTAIGLSMSEEYKKSNSVSLRKEA